MTAAKKVPPPRCYMPKRTFKRWKTKTKTKTKHKKTKPTDDFCTAFQRPGYH